MFARHYRRLIIFILLLSVIAGCRKDEETPTATLAGPATREPATIAPATKTPVPSLGLVPTDTSGSLVPRVIGRNPAAGEELALDGSFELYFDQPMDEAATAGAWQVLDSAGEVVAGQVSWPQPRVLRFKPDRTLKPNNTYRAILADTAAAAGGETLLEGLSFDFSTIGDLVVSQVSPADGTEDVSADAAITVIFNRPVVPLLIAEEQVNLPNPLEITPETDGQGEWVNTSVYVFRPSIGLIGRERYSVAVKADVVNAASASGAVMAGDYEWSFTVMPPGFGYLNLVDRTSSPADNYTDLPLDQAFQLIFLQPMDPASTEEAVSLAMTGEGEAPLAFSWDESFVTLTFTPTELLALDTGYTLRLDDSARSAQGGRLQEGFSWRARTVKYPAILRSEPGNGESENRFRGAFQIYFASPMDRESLEDKVIITPQPSGEVQGQYDRWGWSLVFYGLDPSTSYTAEILPGMADPYGNEIEEGQLITFTTAAYTPSAGFDFPSRISLYRPGGSTDIWVNYRNVRQLEMDLYRLELSQLDSLLYGSIFEREFSPEEDRVWSQTSQAGAQLNARGHESFDISGPSGEALPAGIYFLALDSPQVRHDYDHLQTQFVVVASANVTLKTTTTEAMIWLTDLESGRPLAGVPVAVYDQELHQVFKETTDSQGLIYRDDLALEIDYDTRYYAVTEDTQGRAFGMAISGWNEGVQPWEFGINTNYYSRPERLTAYVYTDRPLYRPGQAVGIKGIVRLNDDLQYSLPDFETVEVNIASFDEVVFSEEVPLSPYGSFAAEVTLDGEAALGSYFINITLDERWVGGGHFNVAEYRKPTFRVDVTSDESDVAAGDTIRLAVDAQFFSGGSVVNGDVEWVVFSSDYTFSADGALSRYNFRSFEWEDRYFGLYDPYNPSVFIASGEGQTDSDGRFTVEIPAEPGDEEGSRRFSFEATVTDLAGNAVSDRTDVLVHRTLYYPGIRSAEYLGQAGEEMDFDVVLVDWDGQAAPGQQVALSFVERRWYSVQEENDFGETIWRTSVEEIPVGSVDRVTVDSRGRATASFVPPAGGIYRAYVTFVDAGGYRARASADVWVAGEEYVAWRQVNDNSFDLIVDADTYRPGDTAELLIASPFQGRAQALITVERGHVKYQDVIELANNSTVYRLPITGEMAPNVFVSVLVVKGVDESNPWPDFKMGMAQFSVEREEQELDVTITPDRATAGPGDEVTYSISVRDHAGQPVEAELSLALVDLALLSLSEPTAPPILDYFYSERWLSVNTALLLANAVDAFNEETRDEVKGGGGGGGEEGVMAVRQEFLDTAYWRAQLVTGADGQATVTVTLPDNLTTWRMDVRAATLDTLVGQATSDIVATLPLLISPQTPRFFVQGDSAVLGAAVHNNSGDELEARVALQAEGVTVNGPLTQLVTVPAGGQALVNWDVSVGEVDRADFVFSVSAGPYTDASRPTLGTLPGQGIPVYKYETPEIVGTSGQLTEGGAVVESIALPIFPDFEVSEGELSVVVAPSLAAAMTDGLDYLTHFPYECTEQIVSRFLPNVLTTRALKAAGLADPELEANLREQVGIALQRLYSRQRPDGGWPWWDGARSDALVSAYVVLGLLEAQGSGYPVSGQVLEEGVDYLESKLPEVDRLDGRYKFNRQAFLVYVLARANQPSTRFMNTLFDGRETLDWYARGFLAQALYLADPEDPRLATLAGEFISAATLSATGTSWEEEAPDRWNWNTDTRTTAVLLAAMIKLDADNPLVANAVRWLMAHRVDGRWWGTQETAWTLMALVDWMVTSGELEADYLYEVALNGVPQGNGQANAATLRDDWRLQVDVADLLSDNLNRLAVGRSDGPGNLYYTAHLQASLPVEQVQALDRGIIISRRYYDAQDRQTPIEEMEQGQTFLARLTIVAPNTLHDVVIEDFLPAGLEAVDTSLLTSQQLGAPEPYERDDDFSEGWGWWYFDHVELRDEKVVLSARVLPQGTYEYVYLVRAATPGEFRVMPPVAHEFYFPEVYGRGDGALFLVTPREG